MNADKPLDGKCIVVTRAVEQSRDLKERLENLGARVLLLPAVSFSEPADTTELDRAIRSLETYDWLLFTSANAVAIFSRAAAVSWAAIRKAAPGRVAPQWGPRRPVRRQRRASRSIMSQRNFSEWRLARELGAALSGKRVLLPRSDARRARSAGCA